MAHLIDKDALVAEIERRMQCYSGNGCEPNSAKWVELISIKHFLDALEVKEVDLEKEINDYHTTIKPTVWFNTLEDIAKHFFELGLKVKQD